MDDVTQVVMTETQKELLAEIRTQYEKKLHRMGEDGVDLLKLRGKFTCHLPYDLLREAFTGEPPVQSVAQEG